ncbi:MAG: Ig-like domain-containing protein [Chloroflexota bacterium]
MLLPAVISAKMAVLTTWVYPDRDYRMTLTVDANGHARTNKVVEYDLDFSAELTNMGAVGAFDEESVRVAEVNSSGALIDSEVPFQFDNGSSLDEPSGTLLFMMTGSTGANSNRHYQIYFDTSGTFTAPAAMSDLVERQSNGNYRGQESFIIHSKDDASTLNTAYYYHMRGGAFASIYDRDGNDWVGYYNTSNSQSGGEFRGIPNLGDVFHPGYNSTSAPAMRSASTVVEDGPLRLSILSVSHDGEWTARWDIFPTYARMTLLDMPDGGDYWFLYEGTPGGELDYTGQDQDVIVRSDGPSNNAGTPWAVLDQELGPFSNETEGEWVYIADATLDRVFFVTHSNDDNNGDSYRSQRDNDQTSPPLSDDNGAMTVFGYGRNTNTGLNRHLTALNAEFTIGFGESKVHNDATALIHNASQDVEITRTNELPVVESNTGIAVNEGGTTTVLSAQLLGSDPEGGLIRYELKTAPDNGTLYLNSAELLVGQTFTQDDIDASQVTYTHDGSETSSDSFELQPQDGVDSGDIFLVSAVINGVNDAPMGVSDSATVLSNLGPVIIDVLDNDQDVDSGTLTVQSITQPSNGSATLNGDNTVSYTPDTNFEGSDSFTYIVSDGALPSAATTVTITVVEGQTTYLPLVIR